MGQEIEFTGLGEWSEGKPWVGLLPSLSSKARLELLKIYFLNSNFVVSQKTVRFYQGRIPRSKYLYVQKKPR
jgi:hypothetical protein